MTEQKLRLLREHIVSIGEIVNDLIDGTDEPQPVEPVAETTTLSLDPAPASANGNRHDPTLILTDVQDAGMALVKVDKKEWVSKLLADVFDASRISDLRRDQWEEFIDNCNAELREGGK